MSMQLVAVPPLLRATRRTRNEIVARINEIAAEDYFGFQTSDLLAYLPWEMANSFLREGADEFKWRAYYPIYTAPMRAAKEYLPYAWDKANKSLGIACMRTMEHMKAWLWLAEFDGRLIKDLFDNYTFYGKGQLVFVSELVEFDWRKHDNGKWGSDTNGPWLAHDVRDREIHGWREVAKFHQKE